MGRQTARKGPRCGQLRNGNAGKRCKDLEFSKFTERQYWVARSGGLISVALTGLAMTAVRQRPDAKVWPDSTLRRRSPT